jgi:hypothetical protein
VSVSRTRHGAKAKAANANDDDAESQEGNLKEATRARPRDKDRAWKRAREGSRRKPGEEWGGAFGGDVAETSSELVRENAGRRWDLEVRVESGGREGSDRTPGGADRGRSEDSDDELRGRAFVTEARGIPAIYLAFSRGPDADPMEEAKAGFTIKNVSGNIDGALGMESTGKRKEGCGGAGEGGELAPCLVTIDDAGFFWSIFDEMIYDAGKGVREYMPCTFTHTLTFTGKGVRVRVCVNVCLACVCVGVCFCCFRRCKKTWCADVLRECSLFGSRVPV